MIVILDACTLINLVNGDALSTVAALPGREFQVSRVVREESKTVATAMQAAVDAGALKWVDDSTISAKQFADAKAEWNLDDGETECILAAEALGCLVASDDFAARSIITERLGASRLTGSIGLLRQAITANALTPKQALESYQLMRERGGFLPEMELAGFTPPF